MKFGGNVISEGLFRHICKVLPEKKSILELGSGEGTSELIKHYKVYSIEENKDWVNKFHSNYIYAPLKQHKEVKNFGGYNMWYDFKVLEQELPKISYDLILIDGPVYQRAGFIKYFNLFNPDVIFIFDDVQRSGDRKIMHKISGKLKRPYIVYEAWEPKAFGVIE